MKYIPGFSNYLETSVPRYADGGAVMSAAPNYLSGLNLSDADLASLYALSANNTGGAMGGGMAGMPSIGAGYVPQFEEKLITAPISNKGNPTAYGANNQFYVSPNDFVRLVDYGTNTVLFEGTGYEAAQKAVEMGQNLTDTKGRKANYQIQTGKTQDSYVPVANEKFNKTDLQNIAGAVGTALPLAMAFVPGLNLGVLGSIAAGAGIGGASAGLKGDNVLKGAAIGGLSAAGGALLGPGIPGIGKVGDLGLRVGTAVGTGLGSTAGGLLTGQNLKNALIGGVVSGGISYLTPDITKSLGIGGGSSSASTSGDGTVSLSGSGPAPIVVSGYNTPSIGLSVGSASPRASSFDAEPKPLDMAGGQVVSGVNAPVDTGALSALANTPLGQTVGNDIINVLGSPLINGTGINIGNIGGGGLPPVTATDLVPKTNVTATEDNPITVTGNGSTLVPSVNVPIGTNTSSVSDVNLKPLTDGTKTDDDTITVTGGKTIPSVAAPFGSGDLKPIDLTKTDLTEDPDKRKKLGVEEYLRLASLAAGLLDGKGNGTPSTYGGGGSGRLNPIFSAKLPTTSSFATRKPRDVSNVDFKTYGYRPGIRFFENGAPVSFDSPPPVTQPIPNNPAGPIMRDEPVPPFARGGRAEFAVNGPGTGRSDDIPAVLSDGEYVIDAETVALLGDGSSKAGAKKLDELRVKVRKHKGKKLAKGRFSANAKKPEAYLSGGRIK